MTYARKMAHKAQDKWLNGELGYLHRGHATALEAVEAVVLEVIERCAKEAEREANNAYIMGYENERTAAFQAGARIRALAQQVEEETP